MAYLKLTGGRIIDPANGLDAVGDLWIADGKVVPAPEDPSAFSVTTIDVSGNVVMAGAVDMHCHIAGPKVNTARLMQPEVTRQAIESGTMAGVPDIYTTGFRYTGLGYTTCFDAAVSPLASRHVHSEFSRIPNVDTGFFLLLGNNHYVMQCVRDGDRDGLDAFLGWVIDRCGAFAPKLVNPGNVDGWKRSLRGDQSDLHHDVGGLTAADLIREVAHSANRLGLPHPVHIHTPNLGMPGNWTTTMETMKMLDGVRAHLTHIQFHSYGGSDSSESTLCSRVGELAAWINNQSSVSVDVGQVMFGRTTSMTADSPLSHYLQRINSGREKKWYSCDTELESGCGVSPIEYRNKNFVNALQWAIGLEWYLLVDDPWKVVMSTDHPNGGSFLAYPQIIRLLMDSAYRNEALAAVNPHVLQHSDLATLNREYTLAEIAIITRAGPARLLGLKNKGHLGSGADADVTVYAPDPNFETMFSLPRWVLKGGELVIEDFEIRKTRDGKTLAANIQYDRDRDRTIEAAFDEKYSLKAEHFSASSLDFERETVRVDANPR